jgi:hypothetical protein
MQGNLPVATLEIQGQEPLDTLDTLTMAVYSWQQEAVLLCNIFKSSVVYREPKASDLLPNNHDGRRQRNV